MLNSSPAFVALGELALQQGRPDDAIALAERAVQVLQSFSAPHLAQARFALARALTAAGKDPARCP